MNKLFDYDKVVFENIKHIDEYGNEYWKARELQEILEYVEWRKFEGVIDKAKNACINSSYEIIDHFVESDKMVVIGSGAKRKRLRYREDILDNMGSDELIANLFRISQTNQKLINDGITTERKATSAHYEVGTIVRDAIKKSGGTMPEKMETPDKSLKEIERDNNSYSN